MKCWILSLLKQFHHHLLLTVVSSNKKTYPCTGYTITQLKFIVLAVALLIYSRCSCPIFKPCSTACHAADSKTGLTMSHATDHLLNRQTHTRPESLRYENDLPPSRVDTLRYTYKRITLTPHTETTRTNAQHIGRKRERERELQNNLKSDVEWKKPDRKQHPHSSLHKPPVPKMSNPGALPKPPNHPREKSMRKDPLRIGLKPSPF